MTDDGMSPFSRLPIELIHHIFNFASAASRRSCLSLCRVASWARHIALPHLFHTVVLKGHLANAQFHDHFNGHPYITPVSASFHPLPLIRNLWMEAASDRIITFFNACDNIEHLALTDDAFLWLIYSSSATALADTFTSRISDHALARARDLHVTMISPRDNWIPLGYSSDHLTSVSPLWSKITHIQLAESIMAPTPQDLGHFTRLSRLAFPFHASYQHGRDLPKLLELQSLKMLVVVIVTDSWAAGDWLLMEELVVGIRYTDSRIYLMEGHCRLSEVQEQWEEEMRDGESIWDKAIRYTGDFEATVGVRLRE
jgi:hypothetical protein